MSVEHIINDPAQFILAGKAVFTMVSLKSNKRFTYRIAKGKDDTAPYFVSILTGPNNKTDYTYAGVIWPDNPFIYRHGKKSKVSFKAPSVAGLQWLLRQLEKDNKDNLAKVEVHHEGRCGRCGRKLTVPESIESGIGPECAAKLGS